MAGVKWTESDIEYLQTCWGRRPIPKIAKTLNRTAKAVRVKAMRLNLGSFLMGGDYITYSQLLSALGKSTAHTETNKSWVQKRGLPLKYTYVNCRKRKVAIIYLDAFWKWAKVNRSLINWYKFEQNSLGEEPQWVKEYRKTNITNKVRLPWSQQEDELLKMLLKQHRYSYSEISKQLDRTQGAVLWRCKILNIKERPIRAYAHNMWTDEEIDKLKHLINMGYTYEQMEQYMGRGASALRGKVKRMAKTVNLDKARLILNANG